MHKRINSTEERIAFPSEDYSDFPKREHREMEHREWFPTPPEKRPGRRPPTPRDSAGGRHPRLRARGRVRDARGDTAGHHQASHDRGLGAPAGAEPRR